MQIQIQNARNSLIARATMNYKTLICAVVFGVFIFGNTNPGPAQRKDEAPKKAVADEVAKVGKARVEAAQKAYHAWVDAFSRDGQSLLNETPFGTTCQLSLRWLTAELDTAGKKEERVRAYKGHLARIKEVEVHYSRDEGLRGRRMHAFVVAYQREAEYWLAKEEAKTR
jgi:hypothetical protein